MVCASAIPEENITSLKYCSRSCQDKAYKAKHRSKVSEHTLIKKMQDLSFLNSVFLKVKEKRLGEIR